MPLDRQREMDEQEYLWPLGGWLRQLWLITRRLRAISTLIVMVLILSISSIVTSTVLRVSAYYLGIFALTFSISGIALLFYFDLTRKRGMILYDAITDKVEWARKVGRTEGMTGGYLDYDRISEQLMRSTDRHSDYRFDMRRFLQATELPIVPGGAGQGFYLVVFILLAVVTTFFMSVWGW